MAVPGHLRPVLQHRPGHLPVRRLDHDPRQRRVRPRQRADHHRRHFTHLGAAGLQLGQDADNATIPATFHRHLGNGLEIGNGTDADPADLALLPANNTISDNWVHNVAVEYTGGVGIFQGYTRYDVIEHNQINNVPYSGISSNWGWGHRPKPPATRS